MADTGTGTRPCWFVGANYHGNDDQTPRFVSEGTWDHALEEDRGEHYEQTINYVKSMRPGDRIAIKSWRFSWENLPFENDGRNIHTLRIKAVGVITENLGDGKRIHVNWTEHYSEPRIWYFYAIQSTVWRVVPGSRWEADALIKFTFGEQPQEQDYGPFLNDRGYGAEDYQNAAAIKSYSTDNIIGEGCFLPHDDIGRMLERLKVKKNLILQGPPGTGKTWLAKRLAYALMGEKNPHSIRAVQFHPNLSYEDFVRGWRPSGDGKLTLTDGVFMQTVNAALGDPESKFAVVIEEINRGNPAQIFGELLTLLEADKRNPDDALELSYPGPDGKSEPVYIPDNLYVIGTMNLADRSLALVDFALRRRFAFATLEPQIDAACEWIAGECGVDGALAEKIRRRMEALNDQIRSDSRLGRQFCIGHSFVIPPRAVKPESAKNWFRQVVETEIFSLLEEYWFDDPEKARQERGKLLADWN